MILIKPYSGTPENKDGKYYDENGNWCTIVKIDGGGRISVGDNHELVTGKTVDEVVTDRGLTRATS